MVTEKIGDESIYLRISELKKGNIQFTDTTNAARLLKEHRRNIRYFTALKKWLVWNGIRWEIDEGGALIHEKGLETVRNIYDELSKTDDYRERNDIENFARISESIRRREAMIKTAQYIKELNIMADDLDRNPWFLNVRNGTIDVLTGEFREHKQEDLITKLANVDYEPTADCPLWKQFIREIMDYKPELIKFLQTAAGWALTGDITDQTMFILYGSGANGKTTFLNTILNLLGDYATSTPTESFMKKNGDQLTNDIARLRGTRFVTTTEAEEGRRLSEPLIKKITGNDQITARFLYGEYFNFTPNFKIFMATNHKPVIKGTDHGIWRRIKLIPFTTTIAQEKQDKNLENKLKQENSGILNWLLEGATNWKKEGLIAPTVILKATDEYRGEMDVIGNFIKQRCVKNSDITIRIMELYKAYADWCEENKEHAVSERFFTMRLKEMGFVQGRTATERFWVGIGLTK
ncbi:DNA primase family protein [Treponema sp. R80B11-R83G3]